MPGSASKRVISLPNGLARKSAGSDAVQARLWRLEMVQKFTFTFSTAGSAMTSSDGLSGTNSERKRRPQPYRGGESSGHALEA